MPTQTDKELKACLSKRVEMSGEPRLSSLLYALIVLFQLPLQAYLKIAYLMCLYLLISYFSLVYCECLVEKMRYIMATGPPKETLLASFLTGSS